MASNGANKELASKEELFTTQLKSFIGKIEQGTATRDDVKSVIWAGVEHDVDAGFMDKSQGTLPLYVEQLEKTLITAVTANKAQAKNLETTLMEIAEIIRIAQDAQKYLLKQKADLEAQLASVEKVNKIHFDRMKLAEKDNLDLCQYVAELEDKLNPIHLIQIPTNQEMDMFDGYCAKDMTEWEKWFKERDEVRKKRLV